jgi:hypothetical protein
MSEHMKHAVCCLQFDFLISIHSKYCLMFQVIKSLVESDPAPQIGIYIKFTGLIFFYKKKSEIDLIRQILLWISQILLVDCASACAVRCQLSSRPNLCHRACGTCCARCNCVPPGTSGNYDVCPCYGNMTTHHGQHKCPWTAFGHPCCRFNIMEIAVTWIRMHKTTTFIQKKHNKELQERGREDKHWIYLWI